MSEPNNKCSDYQVFSDLHDAAYYLTKGTEIIKDVDVSLVHPVIANLVKEIQPEAKKLKPKAEKLWSHLENQ